MRIVILFLSCLISAAASVHNLKNFNIEAVDTISSASCSKIVNETVWDGIKTVDSDAYELRWKMIKDKSIIQIFISAQFSNVTWIGFGLSESGGMLGSDIVTVTKLSPDSAAKVADRYAPWTAFPIVQAPPPYPDKDILQDWKLTCSTSSHSYLGAILERAIDTKDNYDRLIQPGEHPVIFAYGSEPSSDINYHGPNRGTTSVDFFNTPITSFPPSDADAKEDFILSPFEMSGTTDQYICQLFDFKSPTRQIVAVEPLYANGQGESFQHHMLVYSCSNVVEISPSASFQHSSVCGSPQLTGRSKEVGDSLLARGSCNTLVYAWALGGKHMVFPDEAGSVIGDEGTRFVVVELHLNDAENKAVNYSLIGAGVRFHTTTKLRIYNASSIAVGDVSLTLGSYFDPVDSQVHKKYNSSDIPGGKEAVHYQSSCVTDCTSTWGGPIRLFASFQHMHGYGRQIWLSHLRPTYDHSLQQYVNTPQPLISYREFWSFAFQLTDVVDSEVFPADQLNLHCVYDTTKADKHGVNFGVHSSTEMCMVFLWYYPARPTVSKMCGSAVGLSFCDASKTPQLPFQPVRDHGDMDTLVPVTAFAKEDQSSLLTKSPLSLPTYAPSPLPTPAAYGYGSRKEMGRQFKVIQLLAE
mmetsp:Transcript_9911/g.13597  ORF Transcript_9911/g.13597 Transcript_9911/m.13597 type:complete len:638 (+) Transcript_9911:35-1948(+)